LGFSEGTPFHNKYNEYKEISDIAKKTACRNLRV
jgi:hypothetical protein